MPSVSRARSWLASTTVYSGSPKAKPPSCLPAAFVSAMRVVPQPCYPVGTSPQGMPCFTAARTAFHCSLLARSVLKRWFRPAGTAGGTRDRKREPVPRPATLQLRLRLDQQNTHSEMRKISRSNRRG